MLRKKQDKVKILLLGILGLIIPQFISAQEDFQKELCWGLNGGVSISSVNFNPNPTGRQNSLIQGVGGLTVRYISEKYFGLQCELNYSQRGWEETFPNFSELYYRRSLDYIEFPILTHLTFSVSKRLSAIFNLGPQLGYLLSEKIDSNMDAANFEYIPSYYAQKGQNRFDWGLCFGGGLEFRTNSGSFILDGRYYFGLSDVFTNSKINPTYYFAASSNQIISVKFTYLFKLNNKFGK